MYLQDAAGFVGRVAGVGVSELQACGAIYDNVPVLSRLILRAKCRDCRAPISPRYFAIELLVGVIFLARYAHFGLTLAMLKYCVFGFLVLGLIFTDAETFLLPDKLTLTGLALGIAFSLFVPVNDLASQMLNGVSLPVSFDVAWRLFSLLDSVAGAIVGASFIYGAGAIYMRARGVEGMGFGDVKLMAMVGAFLGTKLTIFTIFTASIAGSLFGVWTLSPRSGASVRAAAWHTMSLLEKLGAAPGNRP